MPWIIAHRLLEMKKTQTIKHQGLSHECNDMQCMELKFKGRKDNTIIDTSTVFTAILGAFSLVKFL